LDASAPIPVTLLNPIFGEFVDNCENHKPTDRDNALVLELSTAMSAFYTKEGGRANCIREIFAKYGIHLVWTKIEGTGYETDGDILHRDSRFVIVEMKNEFGYSGAEALFQAILYYLESNRKQAPKMQGSVLPCLIVIIIGSWFFSASSQPQRKLQVHTWALLVRHGMFALL
jgi:hypothetical protein